MRILPALLLLAFAVPPSLPAADQRPNIVVLFVDDLGYADIGPFGATKQKTPNLDRMAREGMKLTSFYAAPVCSVSRAQLMTGCYGARVSVPGVYGPGNKNGLHPQERTIAEYLKDQGYATQIIGKWHLGDQPEFLPTKQGFDHYLGIPYSNDMQKIAKESGKQVVPLVRDDKVLELLTEEDQSRIEERYTEEALSFIRANKEKPFFLYFPHTAVHTPIHPGKAFAGKSQNGRFGDWVEEVDWSVGRVLDTLRELKLDQNTLVVFTSDNGPWLVKGADGGSALPLRGGKGSTWEGGMREPSLAWWPGKIVPGTVCDAVAGTIDLLPTCVKLAGGTVPSEPTIDGRDISPLLFGKTKESQREAHYYFSSYNLQAVRQGPWKLALTPQSESLGKGVATDTKSGPRLYNLDDEIGEQTNLADKHPDIVAKLQALAAKMSTEIGGSTPTSRRPPGEVENPQLLYPSNEAPRDKKKTAPKERHLPSADLSTLKPGDTLTSDAAPQIANRSFTITCTVETTQPDAVLIAHGGASAGYALHLRSGHVVFTIRYGGGESFTEVQSPAPITGSTRIVASLSQDRTLTLTINDQPATTAKAPGLISRQPQEDFCIGHDNARPVATYKSKAKFEGTITGLKIATP
ncbi:sulfatase-like hydrolase/transferase [Prosthecobacter sp.]|uniref:sulfatase-like hydrolase/transferase n=1 Tax=Prosthecobacter sp. TaxID=1965333 RepID=UPI0037841FC2